MPQIRGLSKPYIIIQIEDILCIISLLTVYPSIMLIGQSIYYSILIHNLATNHLQRIKMQGGGTPIYHYPNYHPQSDFDLLIFALTS